MKNGPCLSLAAAIPTAARNPSDSWLPQVRVTPADDDFRIFLPLGGSPSQSLVLIVLGKMRGSVVPFS